MEPIALPNTTEVRRLQLRSRRLVTGNLLGQYRSAFRGSGLVFSDLREYQPGDDVKHIHWKASARSGKVFIKSYEEERQLRVILAVDTSASMRATLGVQSFAKAIEFCSLIGSLTQRGNDLLGMLLFSSAPELWLPPKSGAKRFSRILAALLNPNSAQPASSTDLNSSLDLLATTVRRASIIFVLSDFECPDFSPSLKRLCARHDVILTQLQPSPTTLPSAGLVIFRDAESGELRTVDTSSKRVRAAWIKTLMDRQDAVKRLAERCHADHIVVSDSAAQPLIELMRDRVRRVAR
jgi:uncharacterized protein (DUF58 family)